MRYEGDSEPYMTIAVAGNRAAAGIAIADINLKLIQEVIAAIKIGDTGHAFVMDGSGRLIAHPDISQVLRGHAASEGFASLKAAVAAANGAAVVTRDADGKPAIATSARTASVDWTVIAQQPVAEAFEPIRAALGARWRCWLSARFSRYLLPGGWPVDCPGPSASSRMACAHRRGRVRAPDRNVQW